MRVLGTFAAGAGVGLNVGRLSTRATPGMLPLVGAADATVVEELSDGFMSGLWLNVRGEILSCLLVLRAQVNSPVCDRRLAMPN
jgi:hypothetical protein